MKIFGTILALLLALLTLKSYGDDSIPYGQRGLPLDPMIPFGALKNPEQTFDLYISHIINLDSSRPSVELVSVIKEIKGAKTCMDMAESMRRKFQESKLTNDEILITRCELGRWRRI